MARSPAPRQTAWEESLPAGACHFPLLPKLPKRAQLPQGALPSEVLAQTPQDGGLSRPLQEQIMLRLSMSLERIETRNIPQLRFRVRITFLCLLPPL